MTYPNCLIGFSFAAEGGAVKLHGVRDANQIMPKLGGDAPVIVSLPS